MRRLAMAVLLALALAALTALSGCTSYYRVTDPGTNRVYYTTDVEKGRDGTVEFRDARTGNEVTIQNSEVAKVTKEEYETSRVGDGMQP